ncbi:hypothetical protein B0H14DRAFT_2650908 [Mycena olivaceomarginata]|nr:hypothetical protein B0H14DRAFT_2650908 [Mycena olivaceomarginata]
MDSDAIIGKGAYGVVVSAVHAPTQRRVAIKRITPFDVLSVHPPREQAPPPLPPRKHRRHPRHPPLSENQHGRNGWDGDGRAAATAEAAAAGKTIVRVGRLPLDVRLLAHVPASSGRRRQRWTRAEGPAGYNDVATGRDAHAEEGHGRRPAWGGGRDGTGGARLEGTAAAWGKDGTRRGVEAAARGDGVWRRGRGKGAGAGDADAVVGREQRGNDVEGAQAGAGQPERQPAWGGWDGTGRAAAWRGIFSVRPRSGTACDARGARTLYDSEHSTALFANKVTTAIWDANTSERLLVVGIQHTRLHDDKQRRQRVLQLDLDRVGLVLGDRYRGHGDCAGPGFRSPAFADFGQCSTSLCKGTRKWHEMRTEELKVAWSRSVEMSVADKGQDSGESQPCMLFRDGRRDDREQKDLVCTTETSHRPSAALEKAATTERKCSVVAGLSGGTLFGASAVESISTRSSLPSALFGVSAVERAVCEPEAREFSKISASPLHADVLRAVVLHHQISKMPDSARPSDLLRIWLPPPRFNSPQNTASPRKTRTTESWTKISDRQVKTAGELSLNDSWSIEQKLAVDLIDAVSLDLDILLPPHPKLASSLKKVITTLEEQWNKHFEDNSRWRPSNTPGLESVTERATNILFEAVADAWSHIQATQPTEPQQIEIGCKQAPSFLPGSGFVDKKISIEEGCYIAVWEDKRPRGFTSVLANLSQRAGHGAFNSDISSALSADFVQRPWWILANKGLFYVGLYGVNWIIFSGVTGFCVGHRMNKHMFWSGPVYNRRDKGQELVDETPDGIYTFFGDAPHPNKRQIDVFLLFLAVVLRGAYDKGNSPWVKTLFAKLCALSFTPPSTENTPSPFTPTGEDVNVAAEPDDDNVSSDNSDDHDYTPSASNRTSASTTLLWGPHQLTGRWYGDLV